MQKLKNKIAAIAISIFFILSMTVSMTLIPSATAHAPAWKIPTWAYIQPAPNPIGVGETTHVYIWLEQTKDGAVFYNDYRFHNFQLTITAPDGTKTTQTWAICQDPTSDQTYLFTPTQVGTYKLDFNYPGEDINAYSHANDAYVNDTYLPSSASCTLTVQQDQIFHFPDSYPLPSQYWTRPIYSENPYWYTISSNWLGTGAAGYGDCFPGDAVGPLTAHVMWTYPVQAGGVVGGNQMAIPGDTYFEGSAYLGRMQTPIIMAGLLYYTMPVGWGTSTGTGGPTVCQDLRTGRILWSRDDVPILSFGYIYDTQQANQHGVIPPILFTSNFARAFDAYTGDQLFNVTGVPTGTAVPGPSGEMLKYVLANAGTTANPDWRLGEWNSSKLWFPNATISPTITNMTGTTVVIGSPIGDALSGTLIVDASISNQSLSTCRYDWNISLPVANTMPSSPTIVAAWQGNMLLCMNGSYPAIGSAGAPYSYFAVNLNVTRGTIGSILWWNTVTPLPGNFTIRFSGPTTGTPTDGVFVEFYKDTMQFIGYSMDTGQKLWGPIGNASGLMYYNSGYNSGGNQAGAAVAYGNIYYAGFGGIMYCYDLHTGNLKWTYGNGGSGNSTNSGFEVPGPYPTSIFAIGNGVIYTTCTEHTVETPPYKGAMVRAINATDGTEVWTLNALTSESGPPETGAIADGFATFFNGYANEVYSVGRGPSTTTIQAPLTAITAGNNVVIQGTVMDICAGTKQDQQAADFPNGVPCASDASMCEWMGYVYQQKPEPTNFTGVPVSLDAIDPNGNYINLGYATTDSNGLFHYTWTPPNVPGDYAVTATFAGTNGYWPSNAETAMNVQLTPATAAPTNAPLTNLATTSDLMTYLAVGVIAIIIAIAIVGMLLLRKRP